MSEAEGPAREGPALEAPGDAWNEEDKYAGGRVVLMSKGTTRRTVRIEGELWDAAQTKAEEGGDNLSDVIREALREYLKDTE